MIAGTYGTLLADATQVRFGGGLYQHRFIKGRIWAMNSRQRLFVWDGPGSLPGPSNSPRFDYLRRLLFVSPHGLKPDYEQEADPLFSAERRVYLCANADCHYGPDRLRAPAASQSCHLRKYVFEEDASTYRQDGAPPSAAFRANIPLAGLCDDCYDAERLKAAVVTLFGGEAEAEAEASFRA